MQENIKKLYWKFKKILGQVIILLLLAYALFWIGKHLNSLSEFINMIWIKTIYLICLLLYFILFVNTVSSFISSSLLRIYNAADSKSLAMLSKKKKYRWFVKKTEARNPEKEYNHIQNSLNCLQELLKEKAYIPISKNNATAIYEKNVPFYTIRLKRKKHRVFVIYRSLLNILIIDRLLTETEIFIKHQLRFGPVSQNFIFIMTDMQNEEEILSAGTGIVNYLPASGTAYLYPVFIDVNYGYIFYPQDNSLLPWYKRLALKYKTVQLKKLLIENKNKFTSAVEKVDSPEVQVKYTPIMGQNVEEKKRK